MTKGELTQYVAPSLPTFAAAPDFANAVERYGEWIYDACMFGCKTKGQARMMAWSWLARGKDPMEIKRQYHFIQGELTLKYRVMASQFLKAGGKINPVSRTPDLAKVELEYKGVKTVFSFSYQEALQEDYVWTKDAAQGKTPKFNQDKTVNVRALKDNWSTPRRRMQMLWSRVMTDGISTIAADCTDGYYASEEIGDIVEGEAFVSDEVIVDNVASSASPAVVKSQQSQVVEDAVFVPKGASHDQQSQADVRGRSVPPHATTSQEGQSVPQKEGAAKSNGASEKEGTGNAPQSPQLANAVTQPTATQPAVDRNGPVSPSQLNDLAKYKTDLAINGDAWKQMLAQFGVASARNLTFQQADDFTVTLMRIAETRRVKEDQAGFFQET